MEKDPQTGLYSLYRRRNPAIALDPLSGGSREEIATGLLGLQFSYYDGYEWYETWGEVDRRAQSRTSRKVQYNLSGMPEAVRITMWFDSAPQAKTANPGVVAESPSTGERTNEPPLVFQTVARLNLAKGSQDSGAGNSFNSGAGQAPAPNSGVINQ